MTIDSVLCAVKGVVYRVADTVDVWLEVEVFRPLSRRFPQMDLRYVALFALPLFLFLSLWVYGT